MQVGADAEAIRLASDTLVRFLVPVPKDAADVCPNCQTWLPSNREGTPSPVECENCEEVRTALGRAPLAVAVASLYRKPSPLRDILTRYKGRDDEDDPFDPDQVELVRSILGRLILEHGETMVTRFGEPDALVVVPSTDRPPHGHARGSQVAGSMHRRHQGLGSGGLLLQSGRSYHFIGNQPLSQREITGFLARAQLLSPIVDTRWAADPSSSRSHSAAIPLIASAPSATATARSANTRPAHAPGHPYKCRSTPP